MQTSKVTNIDQLVSFLCDILQEEKDGTIDLKQAVEINNTAGKIINAAKVKVIYLQAQKTLNGARVEFLESNPTV